MHKASYVLLQTLSFWPVWYWYFKRIFDGSDDSFGIAPLMVSLLIVFFTKEEVEDSFFTRHSIAIASLVTLCYIILYRFTTPLPRAVLALTATSILISGFWPKRRYPLEAFLLLLISLPIGSSLQFYFGYPLRWLAASSAAALLQIGGFLTVAEGTCLKWNDSIIEVDAPCSGIKMLWVGIFLTFVLSYLYKLNIKGLFAMTSFSLLVVIIANVFRATSLFYLEAKIVVLPEWSHSGVGLVSFMIAGCIIVMLFEFVRKKKLCRSGSFL